MQKLILLILLNLHVSAQLCAMNCTQEGLKKSIQILESLKDHTPWIFSTMNDGQDKIDRNQNDSYEMIQLYSDDLRPTGKVKKIGSVDHSDDCIKAYYATRVWNDFAEYAELEKRNLLAERMIKIKNKLKNIGHYGINSEIDAGHNRRMKAHIEEILQIYAHDINALNMNITESSRNELNRLIAIQSNLFRKHTADITPINRTQSNQK